MRRNTSFRHVKYDPWRGPEYLRNPFRKLRILVVGESHYRYESCIDDKNLTNRILVKRTRGGERKHFTDAIPKAVLGRPKVKHADYNEFWNSVAFYNYMPYLLKNSKTAPVLGRVRRPQAEKAFREVIEALKPKCILVFSHLVWNRYLPAFDIDDLRASDAVKREAGWYAVGPNNYALAVGMYHPSAWNRLHKRFEFWHPVIKRTFAYAKLKDGPKNGRGIDL